MICVKGLATSGAIRRLHPNFTQDTAITVVLAGFYPDLFTSHHGRQMISGFRAKRLAALRRVYARQADFMLGVAGIKDFDGIAVCNRYDASSEVGVCGGYCQQNA